MRNDKLVYWRYNGDKPWLKGYLTEIDEEMVEIYSALVYDKFPTVLSRCDIEFKYIKEKE